MSPMILCPDDPVPDPDDPVPDDPSPPDDPPDDPMIPDDAPRRFPVPISGDFLRRESNESDRATAIDHSNHKAAVASRPAAIYIYRYGRWAWTQRACK